jgi:hypothetical protein
MPGRGWLGWPEPPDLNLRRQILDTASTTAYHHHAADGRVEVPVGLLDFKTFFRQAAWRGDFLLGSPYSPNFSMTYVYESPFFRLSSVKLA